MPSKTSRTVQSVFTDMSDGSGKTHRQIAAEAAFAKPNVISMMRLGQMKVPLDKAPALARACGHDPVAFTRLVMEEYEPEAWAVLEEIFGEPLTAADRALLDLARSAAPGADYEIDLAEVRREMEAMSREPRELPRDPVALALRAIRFFGLGRRE